MNAGPTRSSLGVFVFYFLRPTDLSSAGNRTLVDLSAESASLFSTVRYVGVKVPLQNQLLPCRL